MDTISFMAGVLCGVVAMFVIACMTSISDDVLNKVGIERIEYCHNVHSNWYEIVWKEVK